MIALIQRVSQAHVIVDDTCVGRIGPGLLALVCAERADTPEQVDRLLQRVLAYRVFADEAGRMNRSLTDVRGGLLVVPQFTLAADTCSGLRPSFTPAAAPALGRELFESFVTRARGLCTELATGVFGADMKVHLVNDGPVTFWLRADPPG